MIGICFCNELILFSNFNDLLCFFVNIIKINLVKLSLDQNHLILITLFILFCRSSRIIINKLIEILPILGVFSLTNYLYNKADFESCALLGKGGNSEDHTWFQLCKPRHCQHVHINKCYL